MLINQITTAHKDTLTFRNLPQKYSGDSILFLRQEQEVCVMSWKCLLPQLKAMLTHCELPTHLALKPFPFLCKQ